MQSKQNDILINIKRKCRYTQPLALYKLKDIFR